MPARAHPCRLNPKVSAYAESPQQGESRTKADSLKKPKFTVVMLIFFSLHSVLHLAWIILFTLDVMTQRDLISF